jgi:hypothetical protein
MKAVRKRFFLKKKQKFLLNLHRAGGTPAAQINKSFLLLFFKKVALSFNLKDQTE